MSISLSLYSRLRDQLRAAEDVHRLAVEYAGCTGVHYDALLSIWSAKLTASAKHNTAWCRQEHVVAPLYQRIIGGESALAVSASLPVGPSALARLLVFHWLHLRRLAAHAAGDATAPLPAWNMTERDKREVRSYMVDSNRITLEPLRQAVRTLNDEINNDPFSPDIERVRRTIGEEYEYRLSEKLHQQQLLYLTEQDLRNRGLSKTPDALLAEPIVVNGCVINWIESKALFGDPDIVAQHLREQLRPYHTRYGSGMVIYWFGFVAEAGQQCVDDGVLVAADFPTRFERLAAVERSEFDASLEEER